MRGAIEVDEQAPTGTREVGIDEAISMAVLFQKNGRLADAQTIYRRVLDVAPDHADALHFSGILAHQQGRSDEAIDLIVRSLEMVPDRADCYSNLGIILKARGRVDEAVAAYQVALALDPSHANAHNNLGVLLKAQRKIADAEQSFRTAIALDPAHTDAYTNLGTLLANTGRVKDAVVCYCKVAVLSPHHQEARRLLALAYCTLGEPQKAVEIFESWLQEEPDNPVARHMLAACSGRDVPERASDAYVEKVFDDFAETFDTKLARLSYRAPAIVAAMLADSGVEPARSLDVLDAGCGTGLCGPLLAPYARTLVGVDLSERMLQHAGDKRVYDSLLKEELTAYLRTQHDAYDVIVSADTLVYFGRLDDVINAGACALRSGGCLIFTVEAAPDSSADDVRIGMHGRYSHSRSYLERVLRGAGLQVSIVAAELRMEAGAPVAGFAVRAVKDGAESQDRTGAAASLVGSAIAGGSDA